MSSGEKSAPGAPQVYRSEHEERGANEDGQRRGDDPVSAAGAGRDGR